MYNHYLCSMLDENNAIEAENDEEGDDDLFIHKTIVVDKGQTLLRIDKFLMDRVQNATRNKVQSAITNGFVKVNEKEIKANYKVKPFDIITVELPTPPRNNELIPEKYTIDHCL